MNTEDLKSVLWHGQDFEVKLPRKLIEDLNALAGEVGVSWLGIVWDRWNMLVFALMHNMCKAHQIEICLHLLYV